MYICVYIHISIYVYMYIICMYACMQAGKEAARQLSAGETKVVGRQRSRWEGRWVLVGKWAGGYLVGKSQTKP